MVILIDCGFDGGIILILMDSVVVSCLMLIDRRSAGLMVRLVYCGSATGLMVMLIDSVVCGFVGVDVDFN